MSRVVDFTILVVIIFLTLIVQFSAGAVLEPLNDQFQDDDVISDSNKDAMDGIFKAVTVWVPLIVQLGSIAIVAWREFRRRRDTAVGARPV